MENEEFNIKTFWETFDSLNNNNPEKWQMAKKVYEFKLDIPQNSTYYEYLGSLLAKIKIKEIDDAEKYSLLTLAFSDKRSIESIINIKNYKQYLYVKYYGNLPKELENFVSRLSIDILKNMNVNHFNEFVDLLMGLGFLYHEAVEYSVKIYNFMGYFKGRDLLNQRYGVISKTEIENIFSDIDLSNVTYDINKKEPNLNEKLIKMLLGENYNAKDTPIKQYLAKLASQDVIFFVENINLIAKEWYKILIEYTKRKNLVPLNLRFNIAQIRDILNELANTKRRIKQKEYYKGKKKTRISKLSQYEERDEPLLESDILDYIGTNSKYVLLLHKLIDRTIELSRMMEGNYSKKFPNITINFSDYTLYTFHPQDRDILSAGFRTDNCFLPVGAGDSVGYNPSLLHYCATTPYGGGVEIKNQSGNTLAFCPILRNGNVMLIHSIEGIKLNKNEKRLVTSMLREWADKIILESAKSEGEYGIVAVLTTNNPNLDKCQTYGEISSKYKFHFYDPQSEMKEVYSNLEYAHFLVSLKEAKTLNDISYDEPVEYDYDYKELKPTSYSQVNFSFEEIQIIRKLYELEESKINNTNYRYQMLKIHQEVAAMELLREIKKIDEQFYQKYQELFRIMKDKKRDLYSDFKDLVEIIKDILQEKGLNIQIDFYNIKTIYYTEDWFIIITQENELITEAKDELDEEYLSVLDEQKKKLNMDSGGR